MIIYLRIRYQGVNLQSLVSHDGPITNGHATEWIYGPTGATCAIRAGDRGTADNCFTNAAYDRERADRAHGTVKLRRFDS